MSCLWMVRMAFLLAVFNDLRVSSSSSLVKEKTTKKTSTTLRDVSQYLSLPFLPAESLSDPTLSERYRCEPSTEEEEEKKARDFHWRGTSLGGWLVIEPWITPSLFYQFLGASRKWGLASARDHVAIDSRTFCSALGAEEANRQLRAHWQHWVTEEDIVRLKQYGVKQLRVPVADWMFAEYAPFDGGCWRGALDELDRVLALCVREGIEVVLDLHAVRGSQNGLDNSGDTGHFTWIERETATNGSDSSLRGSRHNNKSENNGQNGGNDGLLYYEHWLQRGGDWAGQFDPRTQRFTTLNESHLIHTLTVVRIIAEKYGSHPAVVALTPVNEPSAQIPFEVLKEFYWRTYNIVHTLAPHWISLFHDSFRLTASHWSPQHFLSDCTHYAVDTHRYQAWADATDDMKTHTDVACAQADDFQAMEEQGVPLVVGEWSLATDNCAMWLNGLNDNVPGYPKVQCSFIPCPGPYFGLDVVPNAPPDPTHSPDTLDPIGLGGVSLVVHGQCPVDKVWDREREVVREFALAQLHVFDLHTHGFFFWNFKTELETRWDFFEAVENGWLPIDWDDVDAQQSISRGCLGSSYHDDSPTHHPPRHLLLKTALVLCMLGAAYFASTFRNLWARMCGTATAEQRYDPIPDRE